LLDHMVSFPILDSLWDSFYNFSVFSASVFDAPLCLRTSEHCKGSLGLELQRLQWYPAQSAHQQSLWGYLKKTQMLTSSSRLTESESSGIGCGL